MKQNYYRQGSCIIWICGGIDPISTDGVNNFLMGKCTKMDQVLNYIFITCQFLELNSDNGTFKMGFFQTVLLFLIQLVFHSIDLVPRLWLID